jgi:CBS domain-containing protein
VESTAFLSSAGATVDEAMHPGVITCDAAASLREVARMMALYRVHAIVVESSGEDGLGPGTWGVVHDFDLVAAMAADTVDGRSAGSAARTPLVAIERSATLLEAAELMARKHLSHLLVVSTSARRPVGVLSSFDIARALALEPGREG